MSDKLAKLKTLDYVLEGLMRRYRDRVPNVERIVNAMIAAGIVRAADEIENDHIAFRTMGVPQLGIASLEKIFLHYGYERRDRLEFPAKKLDAHWYAPPAPAYPRVFISELRVADLSDDVRRVIRSYTDEIARDPVEDLDLDDGCRVDAFLHAALWRTPTWEDYSQLAGETEYGAWVIYNRYYLNHFTVSVHNLCKRYNTIAEFNAFLKQNGFRLNDSGGEIKASEDGLLLQSSTVAEMVEADFLTRDGRTVAHRIPGSYVEFAERRVLPQFAGRSDAELRREHRRDGFEVGNADKIYESTYRAQTDRDA